uniref:MFS transporter n=1 Tax=Agrobacterium larrymoorei TaxID=160699 RepID=A0A2Z2Q936_9HYPH|nr:MFS transporter [Agrobacterium larrymoorei]
MTIAENMARSQIFATPAVFVFTFSELSKILMVLNIEFPFFQCIGMSIDAFYARANSLSDNVMHSLKFFPIMPGVAFSFSGSASAIDALTVNTSPIASLIDAP